MQHDATYIHLVEGGGFCLVPGMPRLSLLRFLPLYSFRGPLLKLDVKS